MVTLLAELLPLKAIFRWAVRLIALGVLLLLLLVLTVGVGLLLWNNPEPYHPRTWAINIAILYVGWKFFRAWLRRRDYTETGERTIDGKAVPEMLAVAALDVPTHSPDGDYVLRGLPDYGKALLKLDVIAYAYVPDTEPETIHEPLSETNPKLPFAAVIRGWLGRLPRPAMATVAAIVLAAVVVAAKAPWRAESARDGRVAATAERRSLQIDPAPVAAPNPPSIADITASLDAGGVDSATDTEALKASGDVHLEKGLNTSFSEPTVLQDEMKQALDAYRTAAERGDTEAKYMLAFTSANCYEIPCTGFDKSAPDALLWYQRVIDEAPPASAIHSRALTAINRIQAFGGVL